MSVQGRNVRGERCSTQGGAAGGCGSWEIRAMSWTESWHDGADDPRDDRQWPTAAGRVAASLSSSRSWRHSWVLPSVTWSHGV